MFVSHFICLCPTSLYLTVCIHAVGFPCFFYHTPSICPPLFSQPSPPALITPHFALLPRSPFLRPLSISLAAIQGTKEEEEIDSKKDSHVMWRGTKEDPGGLGRLSATPFIPYTPNAPSIPTLHTSPEKTIPEPSTATPEDLHTAHHAF